MSPIQVNVDVLNHATEVPLVGRLVVVHLLVQGTLFAPGQDGFEHVPEAEPVQAERDLACEGAVWSVFLKAWTKAKIVYRMRLQVALNTVDQETMR